MVQTRHQQLIVYFKNPTPHPSLPRGRIMVEKRKVAPKIAPKIRKLGDYLEVMRSCYTIVIFNLTATDTVNKRVLMALKELREHCARMLNDVDELIEELEQ